MSITQHRPAARGRRQSLSTRRPQIHVHMPVAGLGIGIVAPRR